MLWLPRLLCPLSVLLAVAAAVDGHPWRAAAFVVAAAFWARTAVSQGRERPGPPAVDDAWARAVLDAAGAPQGVAAVRALRQAEPRLGLAAATRLADRATR